MGLKRMKTIASHPQAELICVADADEERAQKVGEEKGCPYYGDYNKVTDHPDVDCVIISTPNKFHLPQSIAALRRDKHVFCEKPLARNPAEATEIVKAASKSQATVKVGCNTRYFSSVRKAKELLDSQAIGEVLFLRGWIGHDGRAVQQRWCVDPELAGGGAFLDNGIHILDLSRWFLGEVKECQGLATASYWPVTPIDDNGMGLFKFEKGRFAFVQSSWTEWAGYLYVEVYGKEGFIYIDDRGGRSLVTLGSQDGRRQTFDFSNEPPRAFDLELDDYVAAILQGRQPQGNGFDGLRTVQMACAVYDSSRLGRSVGLWGKVEEDLQEASSLGHRKDVG